MRLRLRRGCCASSGATCGADAFAEFHDGGRLADYAAGDHIAGLVLGDVLVDAGGDELLHAEFHLPLFSVDGQHLRLHDLAGAQHVGGVIDAALGADFADVNQALDAVGDLDERAEVHDFGDRPPDLRADRELALDFAPRIAECLLHTQRNPTLLRLDGEDDGIHALALF